MSDHGILEVGGEKVKVAKADIRNLKSILDELRIPHIIDDIIIFNSSEAVALLREIHDVKVWKVEKDRSVSLKNRFGHSARFEYRELVIPALFEIGFVNLLQLDHDEAEFFGSLIYGAECG